MERISLFKSRGIGEVINDTIAFMREEQNLMKWVLTYILPAYAIMGLLAGIATKDISGLYLSILKDVINGNFDSNDIQGLAKQIQGMNSGAMSGLSSSMSLLAALLNAAVASLVYNYIKNREAKGIVSEEEAGKFLTKDLAWYIGYTFLLGLVILGILLGLLLLGALGFIANAVVGAIGMAVALLVGFYLLFQYASMLFPVCFMEDMKFSDALKRGATLVKSNFWGTLGLAILVGLIIGITKSIVSGALGGVGYLFGGSGALILAQVGSSLVGGLGMVATTIVYAFWYGNLRHELDGTTSSDGMSIIDEIGQQEQE